MTKPPRIPIPLGARVRYTARYCKTVTDGDETFRHTGHHWERVVMDGPAEGIYVGYRLKQNGRWASEDEGYGRHDYWEERGPRTLVALVVTDPRREPDTVDPDALAVYFGGIPAERKPMSADYDLPEETYGDDPLENGCGCLLLVVLVVLVIMAVFAV